MSMNFAELGNALEKVEDAEFRARERARQARRIASVQEALRKRRERLSDGLPVPASRPAGDQLVAQGTPPGPLLGRLPEHAADPMT